MSFMQKPLSFSISILAIAMIFSCADKKQPESSAARWMKQQIEKNPKDATLLYQLGLNYYSGSRYKEASAHLKQAIEIRPDYAEAYHVLGLSLHHLGEFDASIANFQKAINYKIDYWPEAYNLIGSAYRDKYYIGRQDDKKFIELSLSNFLKATERCDDINKSLCLSIFNNIVVSYLDLSDLNGNVAKKDKSYLRKAIHYAKRALTPANRQRNKYQYAMLQHSLGQAYMLISEVDSIKNAQDAFTEALSTLNENENSTEYKMVQQSLELLTQKYSSNNLIDNTAIGSEHSAQGSLTVQFLNADRIPLHDAKATLIESKGDEFIRAHFRERPINKDGSISLPASFLDLPSGSLLSVCTRDEYYCHSFNISDLKKIKTSDNKMMLTVPKTGIISASIVTNKKGPDEPIVVSVLKLNTNGIYSRFRGIGIWLPNNYPFSVSGLPTGTYMIKIKKDYEASTVYYQKDQIQVIAGNKTDLGALELSIE